jgi:hypothetical protein
VTPIISAIIGQLVPKNTINVINISAITPSDTMNSLELISKLMLLLFILFQEKPKKSSSTQNPSGKSDRQWKRQTLKIL